MLYWQGQEFVIESLEYLLSGLLHKKCADPCSGPLAALQPGARPLRSEKGCAFLSLPVMCWWWPVGWCQDWLFGLQNTEGFSEIYFGIGFLFLEFKRVIYILA